MTRTTLFGFFRFAILFLLFYGIPWLITIGVTVGLFRGKRWAVNIGMIFSFFPTLLALCFGFAILKILAFCPLFLCVVYNAKFIRTKLALSQNASHHEPPDEIE